VVNFGEHSRDFGREAKPAEHRKDVVEVVDMWEAVLDIKSDEQGLPYVLGHVVFDRSAGIPPTMFVRKEYVARIARQMLD
jgi:hypothetical protein